MSYRRRIVEEAHSGCGRRGEEKRAQGRWRSPAASCAARPGVGEGGEVTHRRRRSGRKRRRSGHMRGGGRAGALKGRGGVRFFSPPSDACILALRKKA